MPPSDGEAMLSLRRRLGAAWRWPLYSRTRFLGSIAAVFLAVVIVPGLMNRDPTGAEQSATPGITATSTVPTPTSIPAGGAGSTVSHDPTPSVEAAAATGPGAVDRRDAAAVAAAWLTGWCTQHPDEPADGNLSRAAPWMTSAGRRQAQADVPSDESWARTQTAGLSTTCVSVTASLADGPPPNPTARDVVLSATRQITDPVGQILSAQPYSTTRRLIQDSDGRWLVDAEVTAG